MIYTKDEKVQIIKWFYAGNSAQDCVNLYVVAFENRPTPCTTTIYNIINCFEQWGCVTDCWKCHHNKDVPPQVVEQREIRDITVCAAINQESTRSTRNVGAELGVSPELVRRIWKRNGLSCYKYQKTQELFPEDHYRRMEFCEAVMEKANQDENFVKNIVFTDESSFSLHSKHNPAITRYWSTENQHRSISVRTQYPQKLNVWAGMVGDHVLGPFFIDGSLNAQKYLDLLDSRILPAIRALPDINIESLWFQQDGCPAHNAAMVRTYLENVFPDRIMSGFGAIKWPPRSPDLAPNDFFLWGYLKETIYAYQRPENLQQLRGKIVELCGSISPQMLQNVRQNFYHRLGYCSAQMGGIFENFM